MRAAVMALAAWFAGVGGAAAETLTVAVSTSEIRIDSNFTGTSVTVFGVIERDAATVSRASRYEVAIVLSGPPETVVARRKDPILGVWINNASETIVNAPSFYALTSSAPLHELAPPATLERLGIGLDHLSFTYEGRPQTDDPRAAEFRTAFLRLQANAGLYAETVGGVAFMGESVFRSTLRIPSNVPDGEYSLRVYLFSGGALLNQVEERVNVTKTGFEQFVFEAANQRAVLYGLACVILALFTGWLAGVIFRRD